ncbi:MAG: protein kinase [Bryobacterales bacterium]|nr:protein kinase [Bryobacterales bacterium]
MSTWPLPHQFGRYELVEFLGGGMSHVYRARDTVIGRIVAVKVLTPDGASNEDVRQRFLREAQTAGQISTHPNVISVYDYGQEQERPFMVMEFLKGHDLRHLIYRKETGNDARKLEMSIEAAKALEFVHSQGIIHRDIKPDNIHVSHSGVVKLIDFGIAKSDDLGITKVGYTVGTVYYMPPEQVTGQGVTHLVDIYAFGILLFELFTGKRPIDGEGPQQIFYKILKEPVNLTPLLDVNPPEGLMELVAACTEKEKDKRPPSFTEVIEHLRRIQQVATGEMAASALGATRMLLSPSEMETRLATQGRVQATDQATAMSPSATSSPATVASSQPGAIPTQASPSAPPAPAPASAPASSPAPWPPAVATPQPGPAPVATSRTWIYAVAGLLALVVLAIAIWQLVPRGSAPLPPGPKEHPPVISTSTGRMMLVPAGSFKFGPQDSDITLPDYYVDETEVSNRAYMAFCAARSKPLPEGFRSDLPDYPVTNVSYLDAQEFAEWAGKRLPTPEEWEKAARGTDGRSYPWGEDHDPSRAVVADNPELKPNGPVEVGTHAQSAGPNGVLHLAGNVWEFIKEPRTPSEDAMAHYTKVLDPPPTIREPWYTIRGGAFNAPLPKDVNMEFASIPARVADPAIGFRCVKDPD